MPGTRYYAVSDLLGTANEAAPTLCYARVSRPDRKADLDRQQAALEGLLRGEKAGGPRRSATWAPA